MSFSGFIKRHKFAVAVASVVIIILIAFITFIVVMAVLWGNSDVKYDEAVVRAKREFGLDKVLWIDDSLAFVNEQDLESLDAKFYSKYAYFVIGEKENKEIYIMVSHNPKEKPIIASWNLNYTFTQIVEKFNENGAEYVANVPNDYYDREFSSYIQLLVGSDLNRGMIERYSIDGGYSAFYERLDVKAVFSYEWKDDDNITRSCIVAQENGELKAYVRVS